MTTKGKITKTVLLIPCTSNIIIMKNLLGTLGSVNYVRSLLEASGRIFYHVMHLCNSAPRYTQLGDIK